MRGGGTLGESYLKFFDVPTDLSWKWGGVGYHLGAIALLLAVNVALFETKRSENNIGSARHLEEGGDGGGEERRARPMHLPPLLRLRLLPSSTHPLLYTAAAARLRDPPRLRLPLPPRLLRRLRRLLLPPTSQSRWPRSQPWGQLPPLPLPPRLPSPSSPPRLPSATSLTRCSCNRVAASACSSTASVAARCPAACWHSWAHRVQVRGVMGGGINFTGAS